MSGNSGTVPKQPDACSHGWLTKQYDCWKTLLATRQSGNQSRGPYQHLPKRTSDKFHGKFAVNGT